MFLVCLFAPLGGSDRGSGVSTGPNDIHTPWKKLMDLPEPNPLSELLDVNFTLHPNQGKSQSNLAKVIGLIITRNLGASMYNPFLSFLSPLAEPRGLWKLLRAA